MFHVFLTLGDKQQHWYSNPRANWGEELRKETGGTTSQSVGPQLEHLLQLQHFDKYWTRELLLPQQDVESMDGMYRAIGSGRKLAARGKKEKLLAEGFENRH